MPDNNEENSEVKGRGAGLPIIPVLALTLALVALFSMVGLFFMAKAGLLYYKEDSTTPYARMVMNQITASTAAANATTLTNIAQPAAATATNAEKPDAQHTATFTDTSSASAEEPQKPLLQDKLENEPDAEANPIKDDDTRKQNAITGDVVRMLPAEYSDSPSTQAFTKGDSAGGYTVYLKLNIPVNSIAACESEASRVYSSIKGALEDVTGVVFELSSGSVSVATVTRSAGEETFKISYYGQEETFAAE